jgi:hypothetical protein
MGRGWNTDDPMLLQYGGHIKFHGERSYQTAINAELKADALLNVGNVVINQLPSKILEYICTGKPIINIYKSEKCPTLKYLIKYPNALNISESDDVSMQFDKISEFIASCENTVGYEEISKRYHECTVQNVGNYILNKIT